MLSTISNFQSSIVSLCNRLRGVGRGFLGVRLLAEFLNRPTILDDAIAAEARAILIAPLCAKNPYTPCCAASLTPMSAAPRASRSPPSAPAAGRGWRRGPGASRSAPRGRSE
jgi:hypothetical protein